jgi:transcriptional regulator with XRE-family HTH domain
VNDHQLGLLFRALRHHRGLRQSDVARRAGIAQDCISTLERGHAEHLRLPTLRRIWAALDVGLELSPRMPTATIAHLLDAGHARLVEAIVRVMTASGWQVIPEYTFNHYGERGSADVLGWQPAWSALAVIEAKTRLPDIQDVTAGLDRKARVLPLVVRRERGWRVERLGKLLIVTRTTANRSVIRAHGATFAAAFPGSPREARAWLGAPSDDLSAIWLWSGTAGPRAPNARTVS